MRWKPINLTGVLGLAFLLLWNCTPPDKADTDGDLEGTIIDAQTQTALAGVSVSTNPATTTIVSDGNGHFKLQDLDPGTYTVTAAREDYSSTSASATIFAGEATPLDLQLSPLTPELHVEPLILNFGPSTTSLPLTISNTGARVLNWSAAEVADWVILNTQTGSIEREQAAIAVSVDRELLDPGLHSDLIVITSNGGSATVLINVEVQGPILSVAPEALNFATATEALVFSIQNLGAGSLSYTMLYTANWLSVVPSSGSVQTETDQVSVSVDRNGLAYGNYQTTLTIQSDANDISMIIHMTVPDPTNPLLSVFPTSLDFGQSESQQSFYVANEGSGVLNWTVSEDSDWLHLSPQSGSIQGDVEWVEATVDRTTLEPGNYQATILVSSNGGSENIPVTMEVAQSPVLTISTDYLFFDEDVTLLPLIISNSGSGTLTWAMDSDQSWLDFSPGTGSNYSVVNISVSRLGLEPDTYEGGLTISSNGGDELVSVQMLIPIDALPTAVSLSDPDQVTNSSMRLNWSRCDDADFVAYRVLRSTTPLVTIDDVEVARITDRYSRSATLTNLDPDMTYYSRVFVEDEVGQVTGSNTVNATTATIVGSWILDSNLDNVTLTALAVPEVQSPWVAGYSGSATNSGSGRIYKREGTNWIPSTIPSSYGITDIEFVDETLGFAVGVYGTLLQYSNNAWNEMTAPVPTTIGGVEALSSDDVWCHSTNELFHWNGSGWTSYEPGNYTISDMEMVTSLDGWAVDVHGQIYSYNGVSWSPSSDLPGGDNGEVLAFTSTADGWFFYSHVLDHPLLNGAYRFTNGSWQEYSSTSNPIHQINSAVGVSQSNYWAVGYSGVIFNFSGSVWTSVPSPTTEDLHDVWARTGSGWAVGAAGIILRYE